MESFQVQKGETALKPISHQVGRYYHKISNQKHIQEAQSWEKGGKFRNKSLKFVQIVTWEYNEYLHIINNHPLFRARLKVAPWLVSFSPPKTILPCGRDVCKWRRWTSWRFDLLLWYVNMMAMVCLRQTMHNEKAARYLHSSYLLLVVCSS